MTINMFHQGFIEPLNTLGFMKGGLFHWGGSSRIEAMETRSLMVNADMSSQKGYDINSYSPQSRYIEGQKAKVSHSEEQNEEPGNELEGVPRTATTITPWVRHLMHGGGVVVGVREVLAVLRHLSGPLRRRDLTEAEEKGKFSFVCTALIIKASSQDASKLVHR